MKKKRILVVSQYFYPEQFRINDMCEEWISRGYEVSVVTGIPNYPQGHFFEGYSWFHKRKEKHNGVNIIRLPIIPRGTGGISLSLNYLSYVVTGAVWAMFTRVKADKVFIFEVSPMTQALVGVWYAKRKRIPCYLYVQDLWPENVQTVTGLNNKQIINAIGKMVDYIYKNCTKILTTSPSFVKKIVARGCVEEKKVLYWPQYAEEFYRPIKNSVESSGKIIIFTGNIGYAQGLDILPKAAQILKDQGCICKIQIIGDGRYRNEFEQIIKNLGVQEMFEFFGKKAPEEIPKYMANADFAFLSFASNELFANTIPAKMQSYMACGMPIIGAVSGESERIIKEAACGWVAPMGKPEKLAEVIKEAINSSANERCAMSENSLHYCKKYFNKKNLMDNLEMIWE